MKFFKLFLPWILVGVFVLAVFYYIFIWQKADSYKLAIRGKVEFLKKKRGSFYDVHINENGKTRHLVYSFKENEADIAVGDSVFKEKNSKILYIKNVKDGIIREANYQDYLLGK